MRDRLTSHVRAFAIRATQTPRIVLYSCLSDCRRVEGKPLLLQPCLFKGDGSITCEDNVTIGYYPSPFFFNTTAYLEARNPSARIIIGGGTHLNNNCVIAAEHKCIRVGRNVLIGSGVVIVDSDRHLLDPERRRESPPGAAADVAVEDNCFIGSGVRIMKGVTIGENSVVGSGSVVVGDIPANVVAGGNPARILRELREVGTS
jgi:maltose O-acetyltransferase